MEDTVQPYIPKQQTRLMFRLFICLLGGLFIIFGGLTWLLLANVEPPEDFPLHTVVSIEPGMGVSEIAKLMAERKVVASETLLYAVLLLYYDPKDVKASDYVFTEPLDVFEVAKRLTEGDFDSTLINFIHKEGERASTIADNAEQMLTDFDKELFIEHALPHEGRLFPDTYRIPPNYSGDDLIALMRNRYEEAIAPLRPKIASQLLTEEQVIILASIVEREANSPESMRMVAGILQNRLDIMMPLQADASIEYILDKPLKELTSEDLEIDSPYNTYTNFGLPPTPIGNPGLEAIMAVLEPTESNYFFYITGRDGKFYYARTFDEHRANVARYLR